jgi:hypothetical protein
MSLIQFLLEMVGVLVVIALIYEAGKKEGREEARKRIEKEIEEDERLHGPM